MKKSHTSSKKYKYHNFLKYVLLIIIFSFAGALLELLWSYILTGNVDIFDKGIFYYFGWKIFFIPFYGVAGLILIFFEKLMDKRKVKIKLRYKGLLIGLFINIFELVTGLFCLLILKHQFWNYSNLPFNFLGIISIPTAINWVIIGYLFTLLYHFVIKKLLKER